MKIVSFNIRGLGTRDQDKLNWFKKLCYREKPNFIAIQEIKSNKSPEKWIEQIWGNADFRVSIKNSTGNSGGILTIWDPNFFNANQVVEKESFIAVKGRWKHAGSELIIVNVYGPHTDEAKKKMWCELTELMNYDDAMWVLCGDFNEVRHSDDGRKFSKLDRFLISDNFKLVWPNINALVLDKKHSDHCPILLKDNDIDFGPKPVKVFDVWLNNKEAKQIIENSWSIKVNRQRPDCVIRDKMKHVKQELRKHFAISHCKLKLEIDELNNVVKNWELTAEM
ncbi:uncharacterized protein [Rutidosis leptorrhynchoides]|uniref:uncharacterized protein n=1 Tax=Rutidosis leptorrhynchoides TaxID=125765 RepID=UPI003A99AD03